MRNEMPDQIPLFPRPAGAAPAKARKAPAKPEAVKYQRVQPKRRTLCADCIRDIHNRGVAVAPFPGAVRWRRIEAGRIDLLCERCKTTRVEAGR